MLNSFYYDFGARLISLTPTFIIEPQKAGFPQRSLLFKYIPKKGRDHTMFYSLPEEELRTICRVNIEAFEKWARTVIHSELTAHLGANYFDIELSTNPKIHNTIPKITPYGANLPILIIALAT